MTSPGNKKILEKSSFQFIGDGGQNNRSSHPKDQKDWKTVEIVPYSSVQLQKKKQTSEPEDVQIPRPGPDEADDVGVHLELDVNSRFQMNEEEILKLKAQVKNLMKFKSRVQKLAEPDQDDNDNETETDNENDDDEKQKRKKEGEKTKKYSATTESTESQCASTCVTLIMGLIVIGLVAIIACAATTEHYKKIQVNKEFARAQDQVTKDVYLYNQTNYQGSMHVIPSGYLNDNSCYNLNKTGDDFASSIDTHGECVNVFTDSDCTGKKLEFSSETRNQHILEFWGLDKVISSIQACKKHKDQY